MKTALICGAGGEDSAYLGRIVLAKSYAVSALIFPGWVVRDDQRG